MHFFLHFCTPPKSTENNGILVVWRSFLLILDLSPLSEGRDFNFPQLFILPKSNQNHRIRIVWRPFFSFWTLPCSGTISIHCFLDFSPLPKNSQNSWILIVWRTLFLILEIYIHAQGGSEFYFFCCNFSPPANSSQNKWILIVWRSLFLIFDISLRRENPSFIFSEFSSPPKSIHFFLHLPPLPQVAKTIGF